MSSGRSSSATSVLLPSSSSRSTWVKGRVRAGVPRVADDTCRPGCSNGSVHSPPPVLVRGARLVPVGRPAPARPVDLRLRDGRVLEVGPALAPRADERVLDADGRWAVPGLWDAHVHLQTWARAAVRLDLSGTSGAEHVVRLVAAHARPAWRTTAHRSSATGSARPPGPVRRPSPSSTPSAAASRRARQRRRPRGLAELAGARAAGAAGAHRTGRGGGVVRGASPGCPSSGRRPAPRPPCSARWPRRRARRRRRHATWSGSRVRSLAGPVRPRDRPAAGADGDLRRRPRRRARRRAAHRRPARGHRRAASPMGPLKVIFDGSLNTRTAWCCAPYAGGDRDWRGMVNLSPVRARRPVRAAPRPAGLEVARARDRRRRRRRGARRVRGAPGARARSSTCSCVADADLPRVRRPSGVAGERPAGPPARRPRRQRRAVAATGRTAASRCGRCSTPAPSCGWAPTHRSPGSTPGSRWPRPSTAPPTTAPAVDPRAVAHARRGAGRQHRRPAARSPPARPPTSSCSTATRWLPPPTRPRRRRRCARCGSRSTVCRGRVTHDAR